MMPSKCTFAIILLHLIFLNISCKEFENLFVCILNEHAPIRANNACFMNIELCKAMIYAYKYIIGLQMNNFFIDAVLNFDIKGELHMDVSTSSDPITICY